MSVTAGGEVPQSTTWSWAVNTRVQSNGTGWSNEVNFGTADATSWKKRYPNTGSLWYAQHWLVTEITVSSTPARSANDSALWNVECTLGSGFAQTLTGGIGEIKAHRAAAGCARGARVVDFLEVCSKERVHEPVGLAIAKIGHQVGLHVKDALASRRWEVRHPQAWADDAVVVACLPKRKEDNEYAEGDRAACQQVAWACCVRLHPRPSEHRGCAVGVLVAFYRFLHWLKA